jgi:L-glyceraldehyde 3-phosphate reductase
MNYQAKDTRYDTAGFRRCGKSGLKLPEISLGLWQNFSDNDLFSNCREILRAAFDHGITHFDLANNYGPSSGFSRRTVWQKSWIRISGHSAMKW